MSDGPVTYLVTLETPRGQAEIEVNSMMGPDVAGRRARVAAVLQHWGDLDEIEVVSVEELDQS